jgi:DNA-directed RNA polymerase specialized sigma subunit
MSENYTHEDLQHLAWGYVLNRQVPESLQEEAVQEFVTAAVLAGGEKASRRYQYKAGQFAVGNYLRLHQRWQEQGGDDQASQNGEILEGIPDGQTPASLAEGVERNMVLKQMVGDLPEAEREIIRRHFFAHESLTSIAKSRGYSNTYATFLLQQALQKIRFHMRAKIELFIG